MHTSEHSLWGLAALCVPGPMTCADVVFLACRVCSGEEEGECWRNTEEEDW